MADILSMTLGLGRGRTLQDIHLLVIERTVGGDCISKSSGGYVRQRAAGANMSVDVDAITSYRLAGSYGTPTSSTNVAFTTSDPASPRIDLLYLDGTGFHVIPGAAAAILCDSGDESDWLNWEQPFPPSMASQAGIPLAKVLIRAGATTILDADICMLGSPFVPTAANEHSHYSSVNGGVWLTATIYSAGIWVEGTGAGTGITYACTVGHTSGASTQPGVGASWQTVWRSLATGSAGAAGLAGATWQISSGVPSDATGSDDDLNLDVTTGDVYQKVSGAWGTALCNIFGSDGTNGTAGAAGSQILATTGVPLNTLGIDGDWADDQVACIKYGPKAGGVWPTGSSYKGQAGGTMAWYGPYSAAINYPVNAGVSFAIAGIISSYICIQANGPLTIVADPTNASYWQITSQGGAGLPIYDEQPSGALTGANVTFTLAYVPTPASSLRLYLNGKKMRAGGNDYTLTTATIVFVGSWAPELIAGAWLSADYTH
jgi:hypothetical protein